MKYLQSTFSVNVGDTKAYRDGWERIFGAKHKRKGFDHSPDCPANGKSTPCDCSCGAKPSTNSAVNRDG